MLHRLVRNNAEAAFGMLNLGRLFSRAFGAPEVLGVFEGEEAFCTSRSPPTKGSELDFLWSPELADHSWQVERESCLC